MGGAHECVCCDVWPLAHLSAARPVLLRPESDPAPDISGASSDSGRGNGGRRGSDGWGTVDAVRVVIAECQVDYGGRLTAHLPMARRLIVVKADGSVSVHADDRAYKPLNWMSPPCTTTITPAAQADLGATTADIDPRVREVWMIRSKSGDFLQISVGEIEEGWSVVQREYMTAIGPVDLLCRDELGCYVAVEVKRRGEIDGVEQLTRYLDLMNRDPLLGEVRGVFAAQQIKPQARTLATDRGISCLVVDYDALRGLDHAEDRLF